jgi:hypothetical protein
MSHYPEEYGHPKSTCQVCIDLAETKVRMDAIREMSRHETGFPTTREEDKEAERLASIAKESASRLGARQRAEAQVREEAARSRDAFENLPSSEIRRIKAGQPIADAIARTQGMRLGSIDNPSAPYVGANAPETSIQAVSALPNQGTKRRICYELIKEAGDRGLCDHELEAKTGWIHQSASACRNSLMKDGHIKAGKHRRKTPSGNDSIAWVVSDDHS